MTPAGSPDNGCAPPGRIRSAVLDAVVAARRRYTMRDLERAIALREVCPRPLVRSAIRGLIEEGILEFRYTFGQSYLALSFRHPVDVSPVFTIVPPGHAGSLPPPRIPIAIAPGISFGDGRHPTTRLALQALEKGWAHLQKNAIPDSPVVMDIGTGSGILAIAAARLGAGTVFALDIDACARAEAQINIGLNPKTAAIQVTDRPLEAFDRPFDVVLANLRLPTLVVLGDWIAAHLRPTGCAVVSGCREEEWDRLSGRFNEKKLCCAWLAVLGGWVGGLFLPEPACASAWHPADAEKKDDRL